MTDIFTPVVLGLHLATTHFGAPANLDLQSVTPGVYLRSESGLTVGAFCNSVGRSSVYGAWTWSTRDEVWSITVGGATGYQKGLVTTLIIPSARISLGSDSRWAARISYLPKQNKNGAHGLHLSFERKL